MIQTYRTLHVAGGEDGVLSVVIDAPPMNLIGPELVRDLVTLLGDLDADANIRVAGGGSSVGEAEKLIHGACGRAADEAVISARSGWRRLTREEMSDGLSRPAWAAVLRERGEWSRHLNVFVDGTDAREGGGPACPLTGAREILVIAMLAGG